MKRAAVVLFVLIAVMAPPAHASLVWHYNGSISLIPGDYSSGVLDISNPWDETYKIAVYQRFWVVDSSGRKTQGFNLTLFPETLFNWSPGGVEQVNYNLSCTGNVKPGDYTLYIRLIAVPSGESSYRTVEIEVPLHVLEHPLIFGVARAYVLEDPSASHALNGQTVVVFSNVKNIGHKPVNVTASASLTKGGKTYFSEKKELTLEPGDELIKFRVPIGYDLPEGTYGLDYEVKYPGGVFRYSTQIPVRFGVNLLGVSVEHSTVPFGERNRAYVTIFSERSIKINVTANARTPEGNLSERIEESLTPGTSVVSLELPTNVSGRIRAEVSLSFRGRSLGRATVEYTVLKPPEISSAGYTIHNGEVEFILIISNPSHVETGGLLVYNVSAENKTLDYGEENLRIPPEGKNLSMSFKVPSGKITYNFTLKSMGWSSSVNGSLVVEAPETSTTATTRPTSPSSTSTTVSTSPAQPTSTETPNGENHAWQLIAGLILITAAVAWFYINKKEKKPKKRVRPKPKRSSPLGKFKKPKKPEFRENKELPKRR